MNEYEDLVYKREETVANIGPWYWLKTDSGAWEGPKLDWEMSHMDKWFRHVKDYSVCFQAGSCLGMYPRLLAEKFGVVFTCEPNYLNHYVAGLNCQLPNIYRFNAAVGLESGNFTAVERSGMDNVGMHKTNGAGTVPIISIDSLNLPTCGLIALDIEGYEIHAIRGAMQTIRRCSPVVVCECPRAELINLMTVELGYVIDCTSVSDTVFVKAI